MKKRILACLLSVLMLFASWPAFAADDAVVLTVNVPAAPISQGSEFYVTVELSDNPGLAALEMTLAYDQNIMKCVDIISEEILLEMVSAVNPAGEYGAMVAAIAANGISDDGLVATYQFLAKEDILNCAMELTRITVTDTDVVDIPYVVYVGSEKQEEVAKPDENENENEEHQIAPSRPDSGSPGDFVETPKNEEPVIPEQNGDEAFEEIFETESEVPEAVVHLFGDTKDHWAESYINKAVDVGLFKGDDKGNFNPEANITRGQFITVLWRMAGSPKANAQAPFVDIKDQISEFQTAISWGYENGYINGVSETAFSPEGTLTREAGMKILHYYSGGKTGNEFMFIDVYDNAFEDSNAISSWAKMSIYWGVYNKLISGVTSTQLAPQGVATRAQIAKILVDYRDTFNQ